MGIEFVYFVFIVAIIIGVGIALLQSPRGKGWIGEQIVKILIQIPNEITQEEKELYKKLTFTCHTRCVHKLSAFS